MTRVPVLWFTLVACSVVIGAASQNPPGQLPRFRGGVDVVVIDASVLDRSRQPVRGLKAEDFVVLDDASPMPAGAIGRVKQIGHSVIDKLAPEDLALVAFTSDRRGGQEFTHDRARLRAAVDRFHGNTDAKSMMSPGFAAVANEPASAQAGTPATSCR